MNHSALALILCVAAAGSTFAQQSQNDVETLKKYGGDWAVDCAKPGTRLTVSQKTLTLSVGGQQIRTATPLTAFSYYGKMEPPKGFNVALLGEVAPAGLTFLAMNDPSGPYLTVDADPGLHKRFGKATLIGKFRRCP